MALTVGQQGKLGKEILTITSISEDGEIFTCDNGHRYMVKFSQWMTEGVEIKVRKPRKNKKVSKQYLAEVKAMAEDNEKYENATDEERMMINREAFIKLEEINERSRMNQRGSSLRY